MNTKIKNKRSPGSTNFRIGDLVMLKPAADITHGDAGFSISAYDHKDWVGVITQITKRETKQLEIWGTCMVMWRGRKPVNEFLDHLAVISEAR